MISSKTWGVFWQHKKNIQAKSLPELRNCSLFSSGHFRPHSFSANTHSNISSSSNKALRFHSSLSFHKCLMHFNAPPHTHTLTHVSLNPSATLARLSWIISPFGLSSRSHCTLKWCVSMVAVQSGSPAENQLACQSHGQPSRHAGVYLRCCLLLRTLTRPLARPSVTGLLQWLSGKQQIVHRKQGRNS